MTRLVLTCEHGGNTVPAELMPLFSGAEDVLASHRGWDIGALDLFRTLEPMADHGAFATLSRLCIEMNRSIGHPKLFSAYTRTATKEQQQELLQAYSTYRDRITAAIQDLIAAGDAVLHISVHSFTPVLDGVERHVDIGLLYDPSRPDERGFCGAWRKQLAHGSPDLIVRMNRPYKGTADGFTTALRKVFPRNYSGIELEVNQRFAPKGNMDRAIKERIERSLVAALAKM